MKKTEITQHEINQATRPNIQQNKKKYTRKAKHKTEKAQGDIKGNEAEK